jgi:hypothetical protein
MPRLDNPWVHISTAFSRNADGLGLLQAVFAAKRSIIQRVIAARTFAVGDLRRRSRG